MLGELYLSMAQRIIHLIIKDMAQCIFKTHLIIKYIPFLLLLLTISDVSKFSIMINPCRCSMLLVT